jgi:DNA-binding transcriptional LysR family regulator
MALKQFEAEVGGRLFETDRKNALTALGSFTLETARAQIQGYDKAIETIRAFAQNRIGKLTLGCVPSVAANLMPHLLGRLVADRRGVEIELFDVDSAGVARLVESGQVDLGIAGLPRAAGVVSFQPLFHDRFKVLCSAGSPVAQGDWPVSWDDITGRTLILNGASEAIGSPGYRALAAKATLMVRNVTSLIAMVEAGIGVTLLPALSTAHLPAGVRALSLADGSARREVGVLERQGTSRSPIAAAFLDLLTRDIGALLAALDLEPA